MQLSGNTILITGGSSGIGLELSKQLIARKNKILICGRSPEKLATAKKQLPELHTFTCDLSDPEQCNDLIGWVKQEHPDINVLINNAAMVHAISFVDTEGSPKKAESETQANFLAPLRLIHGLYPLLERNPHAYIVNITTGLVYAPRAKYPFYNATKAALHSFTQVLRHQTRKSPVSVVEVLFPAVRTPWHKGDPPKIAIGVDQAVQEMLQGLVKGKEEIKVGGVRLLYWVSRMAPAFAFRKVNQLD
jgi:uncharacterized oxidoreductase